MNERFGKPILYCDVCGEALETMLDNANNFIGWDRVPRVCLCERTRREKEEREQAYRKYIENYTRNRSRCFSDNSMYDWRFDTDDGSVEAMSHARNYVEHFDEMKAENIGLLLWGGVGTGKSFMAACIANALLEKEYSVKMTNFATIINDMFSCEDKNEYIEALMRYTLLIIDDLGAERSTEYAVENVFNVIDRRYRSSKPLIVTTNLNLSDLKEEPTIDKKRIYDRVLEMCVPVCVNGESKRKAASGKNMERFKELIS